MLRTLKVISYRATHFLSFLIIIMVINVYKLKSLTPDERSAETETQEQKLCPFLPRAQSDDTVAILLFLLDCPPSPSPLRAPSLLTPQGTARNQVPRACRGGSNKQSSGAEAETPDLDAPCQAQKSLICIC